MAPFQTFIYLQKVFYLYKKFHEQSVEDELKVNRLGSDYHGLVTALGESRGELVKALFVVLRESV